jgi:diacylglycerol kinase (ATP)
MEAKRTRQGQSFDAEIGFRRPQSAMPGRGGLVRIKAAFWNTVGGIKEGLNRGRDQAGGRNRLHCLSVVLLHRPGLMDVGGADREPVASPLDRVPQHRGRSAVHIQPEKHDPIRITKDLASAGVFFALLLVALVWIAAAVARFAL